MIGFCVITQSVIKEIKLQVLLLCDLSWDPHVVYLCVCVCVCELFFSLCSLQILNLSLTIFSTFFSIKAP
jgi:hypothetical protein